MEFGIEKGIEDSQIYSQKSSYAAGSYAVQSSIGFLQSVYDGGKIDDLQTLSHLTDDKSKQKRFEKLEELVKAERINNFKLVWEEYPKFVPKPEDRIKIDTQALIAAQNSSKPLLKNESSRKDLVYFITRDITNVVKKLVAKYFLLPKSIRVFMKVLVLASRGIYSDVNIDRLETSEVKLLSSFLVAGWLNIPFKNPRAFGGQPLYQVSEVELEFKYFKAARITFEHLMTLQLIPTHYKKQIEGIAIDKLNAFINEQAHRVYVFWTRLVQISLKSTQAPVADDIVEASVVRVKDLDYLL